MRCYRCGSFGISHAGSYHAQHCTADKHVCKRFPYDHCTVDSLSDQHALALDEDKARSVPAEDCERCHAEREGLFFRHLARPHPSHVRVTGILCPVEGA